MQKIYVDFGTTNTGVAVQAGDSARMLKGRGISTKTLQSFIFFGDRPMKIQVGEKARKRYQSTLLTANPTDVVRLIRAIKKSLGKPKHKGMFVRKWGNVSVPELVSLLLDEVKDTLEIKGIPGPYQAIFTLPVLQDGQLKDYAESVITHACGFTGDIEPQGFITETQAMLAYLAARGGSPLPDRGKTLLVDIGGGTTDVGVYRADDGRLTLLHEQGMWLAGSDFDETLLRKLIAKYLFVEIPSLNGYGSSGKLSLGLIAKFMDPMQAFSRREMELMEWAAKKDSTGKAAVFLDAVNRGLSQEMLEKVEILKIALSDAEAAELDFFDRKIVVNQKDFISYLEYPYSRIEKLVAEVAAQAGGGISHLFFTGSGALSHGLIPLIEQAVGLRGVIVPTEATCLGAAALSIRVGRRG